MQSTEPARYGGSGSGLQSRPLSSGERRRALQLPGEASFMPRRGTWALTVPVVAPGWWRCRSEKSGDAWRGSAHFLVANSAWGGAPLGGMQCTCVGCSEVHQPGNARTDFGVCLHKNPLLRTPFPRSRFSAAARWTPRLRPSPPPLQVL